MIKTQDYFREVVTMLFIQKRVIVVTTLLFTVGACLIAFFWPPVYVASGQILVKSRQAMKSPESVEDVPAELTELSEDNLFSEMQILLSSTLVDKTVARLKATNPVYAERYATAIEAERLASRIESSLTSEVVPKTHVINLSLSWGEPQEAELILAALFDEYLAFRAELDNPQEALRFFQDQIDVFNEELKQREDALVKLAAEGQFADPRDEIKSNLLIYENMVKDLSDMMNDYNTQSAFIEHLQRATAGDEMNFFTAVSNLDIGDMGKKLQELLIERQRKLEIYNPDSPQMQHMNGEVEQAAKELRAEVRRYIDAQLARLEGIRGNIVDLRTQMEALLRRNVELYQASVASSRLNREISLLEESYKTFGKRLEEARIAAQTETDRLFRVTILTKAQARPDPVFPRKSRVIVLGVVMGLLIGCTIAFMLEFFDHTFKRPEDVGNYANLPNVYSIKKH